MKKTALLLIIVIMLGLGSCSKKQDIPVYFICPSAGVSERGEFQGIHAALTSFSETSGFGYSLLTAENDTESEYLALCRAAAAGGAKVIVLSGEDFVPAAETVSKEAPEVNFLFIDTAISNPISRFSGLDFSEAEGGFLSGFASVMEGCDNLLFLADNKNAANTGYYYGFIRGAEYAAGLKNIYVGMNSIFPDEQYDKTELKDALSVCYNNGTDIIFVCGSNIYKPAVAAANISKNLLFGANIDQAGESERFVSSVIKSFGASIASELSIMFENNSRWTPAQAGIIKTIGIKSDAVLLPTYKGGFRFSAFTQSEYQSLIDAVKSGAVVIDTALDSFPVTVRVKFITNNDDSE